MDQKGASRTKGGHFCIAPGCSNEFYRVKNKARPVHFHILPLKREAVLRRWLAALKRANPPCGRNARVCSQHFVDEDYKEESVFEGDKLVVRKTNKLKPEAAPSVFDFSSYKIGRTDRPVQSNASRELAVRRKERAQKRAHVAEQSRAGSECDAPADRENPVPPKSPLMNIKDETIDKGYDCALLPQSSIKQIKQELEHQEDELRIRSVYSLGDQGGTAINEELKQQEGSECDAPADRENPVPPKSPLMNIKDETIDKGYDCALLPQSSIKQTKQELEHQEDELRISSVYSVGDQGGTAINEELKQQEDELKISSVYSLGGDDSYVSPTVPAPAPQTPSILGAGRSLAPAPAVQPVLQAQPPSSGGINTSSDICSGCSKVLVNGQTAYQKKGYTELFCSTVCLTLKAILPNTVQGETCNQPLKLDTKNKAILCKPSMRSQETQSQLTTQAIRSIRNQGSQCCFGPTLSRGTQCHLLPIQPRHLPTKAISSQGTQCDLQTIETPAGFSECTFNTTIKEEKVKVVVLPVPVPVFIPVPMNMYSQYTPVTMMMPVPVPVPMVLRPTLSDSESKDMKDPLVKSQIMTEEVEKRKPISHGAKLFDPTWVPSTALRRQMLAGRKRPGDGLPPSNQSHKRTRSGGTSHIVAPPVARQQHNMYRVKTRKSRVLHTNKEPQPELTSGADADEAAISSSPAPLNPQSDADVDLPSSSKQVNEKIPDEPDELSDSSGEDELSDSSGEDELSDSSGEEYVPSSSGESTDGSMICEISPQSLSTPCQSSGRSSATPQSAPDSTTSASRGVGESASVSFPAMSKNKDGSPIYMRKNYCLFCGSAFQKVSRHLEAVHSDEVEVARAISCPKSSKQRQKQLECLRKKGNFVHNAEVLRTGRGELVPCKKPREGAQAQDFEHCVFCQGLFARRKLWRHVRNCKFKSGSFKSEPGKNVAFLEPAPSGVPEGLWKLISGMSQCQSHNVSLEVKSDWCIMELAKHLYNKGGSDADKHVYIRQQLKELGRLRLHGRECTPLRTIKDYFRPENFMLAVTAVKHTAGYDDKTDKYRVETLPKKLGHSLKKICQLLQRDATMKGEKDTAEDARCFLENYEAGWHALISATTRISNIKESKWNSPQLLPFTEDVKTLHSYLDDKQQCCCKDLVSESSSQNWTKLARVTLAQVNLFNRCEEGEVSKMSVSAFASRDASESHDDVNLPQLAPSDLEQQLCQHFIKVEIRGKGERNVPVFLTKGMQGALDLLIEKRDECGVLKENAYMFARPSAMTHYKGSYCIREFVTACGAKDPHSLTSTKLKRHIATLSNVLCLNDTELDQLADFLGSERRVERQFYHLADGTLQLAKICKILTAHEQGRLAEFKGMSLDDVNIDPNETVQLNNDAELVYNLTSTGCHSPETATSSQKQLSQSPLQGASQEDIAEVVNVQRKPHSKMRWKTEEIAAVEKHLMYFIETRSLPKKYDCELCLKLEPEALGSRNWLSIKFYIKNRITAMNRRF